MHTQYRPATEVSAKHSMAHLADFKPSILPLPNRVCCAGYCPVRIAGLLHQLPAFVNKASDKITPSHFSEVLQANHEARSKPDQFADGAYARRILENPSLAHLTVTTDLSSVTKKSMNVPMKQLLGINAEEIQSMQDQPDILFNDLDCLCLFLCDLLRDQTMPGATRINYTRMRPGGQVHRQCMLVCWCCHSVLDSSGQVMEVTVG